MNPISVIESIEDIETYLFKPYLTFNDLITAKGKVMRPKSHVLILVKDMKVFNNDIMFSESLDWLVKDDDRTNGYSGQINNMSIYERPDQPENVVTLFSYKLSGIQAIEHILLKGN